ncbi:hypothetical protein [Nocardioides sp. GY 10113]|uniref:hypothetical protein n=1 Tax=Nocardioides sp. GY 10113 TaxID=2569761 RepID=UPI0014587F57|nr:hypothetical protein [Nocardioides sp. GY 10113]
MSNNNEYLVRAERSARLEDARQWREARAHRLSRKAERAAQRARVALARSL